MQPGQSPVSPFGWWWLSPKERRWLIAGIAETRTDRTLPILAMLAEDETPGVAQDAVQAMARVRAMPQRPGSAATADLMPPHEAVWPIRIRGRKRQLRTLGLCIGDPTEHNRSVLTFLSSGPDESARNASKAVELLDLWSEEGLFERAATIERLASAEPSESGLAQLRELSVDRNAFVADQAQLAVRRMEGSMPQASPAPAAGASAQDALSRESPAETTQRKTAVSPPDGSSEDSDPARMDPVSPIRPVAGGAMLIATFGPSTASAWVGRTITYDDPSFVLQGHGPIAAEDVLAYDRAGRLLWAYEGLREWVGEMADPRVVADRPLEAAAPGQAPGVGPDAGKSPAGARISHEEAQAATDALGATQRTVLPPSLLASKANITQPSGRRKAGTSRPALSRRLVVAIVAGVAILALVAALALSGVLGGSSSGWPKALEGVWVSVDHGQVVVSREGGRVVLRMVDASGGGMVFTFQGDTLSYDEMSGDAPSILHRRPGSKGDFIGKYDYDSSGGVTTIDVEYDDVDRTLTVTQGPTHSYTLAFRLAEGGETLYVSDKVDSIEAPYVKRSQ